MVADQRHYLAPLPEPQETERATVLTATAERLRDKRVTAGIEPLLQELADIELRATGAWSLVEGRPGPMDRDRDPLSRGQGGGPAEGPAARSLLGR